MRSNRIRSHNLGCGIDLTKGWVNVFDSPALLGSIGYRRVINKRSGVERMEVKVRDDYLADFFLRCLACLSNCLTTALFYGWSCRGYGWQSEESYEWRSHELIDCLSKYGELLTDNVYTELTVLDENCQRVVVLTSCKEVILMGETVNCFLPVLKSYHLPRLKRSFYLPSEIRHDHIMLCEYAARREFVRLAHDLGIDVY